MTIITILKIFSDCCVCFAILGAFPDTLPYTVSLLYPSLICALAAGLAAEFDQRGKFTLSRLCTPLPLLALLPAGSPGEMIILIPAVIYTGAVILRGQFQLEYYSYSVYFRRSLYLLAALFLTLSAIASIEPMTGDGVRQVYADVTLRYGVVHLICGVVLQRRLRLGEELHGQGGAGQMAVVLGGVGAAIFLFLRIEPLLKNGIAFVFQTILGIVIGAVIAVARRFSIDVTFRKRWAELLAQYDEESVAAGMEPIATQPQQAVADSGEPVLWWLVLVAAVLLVAVALMFMTFRQKRPAVRTAETTGTVDAAAGEKKRFLRSNRAKVRQIYREFLRLEKGRGLSIQKDYTSMDILSLSSTSTDKKAAAQLREIYLHARYDKNCEISRAQVDAAKAALKKCRTGTDPSLK